MKRRRISAKPYHFPRQFTICSITVLLMVVVLVSIACSQDGPGSLSEADPGAMPSGDILSYDDIEYSAVIYVEDGRYSAKESIPAGVSGGTAGKTSASDISIVSKEENVNGIFVTRKNSEYTLSHAVIDLTGNGSNDFAGVGAGALVTGGGTLVLKDVHIETRGCIRTPARMFTWRPTTVPFW